MKIDVLSINTTITKAIFIKMAEKNQLSDITRDYLKRLHQFIQSLEISKENQLVCVSDFDKFTPSFDLLDPLIKTDLPYNIDAANYVEEEGSGELAAAIAKFNENLEENKNSFLLLTVFLQTAQALLEEYVSEVQNKENTRSIQLENFTFSENELSVLAHLSLLMDYQIYLYLEKYPSLKAIFYLLVQHILDVLFSIKGDAVAKFWLYLESRRSLIKEKIFDQKLTSDRISVLQICNGLTDRYRIKVGGKTDSYKKDSFNDKFQNRVRTFLSELFQFEDNTGLNKYFTVAGRLVKQFAPSKAMSWSDELIQDVLLFKKVARDPYIYLKAANSRQLSKVVDTVKRINSFIMEEEKAFASKQPQLGENLVKGPKSKAEEDYVKKKYADKMFYPESYWLSPFESSQRGKEYENIKRGDEADLMKRLETTKTRQVLLLQIYLLSNVYNDLSASGKKSLLKEIGAPANVKHITDDSIPESLANTFYGLKKDIAQKYRSIDNQFGLLMHLLSCSERNWWGWLIYGKDSKTGKSLFVDRTMSDEEAKAVQDKTATVIPFKEKRYFNLYATPQLSRKMAVKTGLLKLKKEDVGHKDYGDDIESYSEKLKHSTDPKEREDLVEERTVLIWKQFKSQRQNKWLSMDLICHASMLVEEVREEPEESKSSEDSGAMEVDEPESKQDGDVAAGGETEREDGDSAVAGDEAKQEDEDSAMAEVLEETPLVSGAEKRESKVDEAVPTEAKEDGVRASRKRALSGADEEQDTKRARVGEEH